MNYRWIMLKDGSWRIAVEGQYAGFITLLEPTLHVDAEKAGIELGRRLQEPCEYGEHCYLWQHMFGHDCCECGEPGTPIPPNVCPGCYLDRSECDGDCKPEPDCEPPASRQKDQ